MKILITGNMGYIGPRVVSLLRSCYSDTAILPECKLDVQYFADVRKVSSDILQDIDAVVHLAVISNDPMGNRFEDVTLDINYRSTIKLAKMAKAAGVKTIVFASSCSMYGSAEDQPPGRAILIESTHRLCQIQGLHRGRT